MVIGYDLKSGKLNIVESNCSKETIEEYCDYSGATDFNTGDWLGPWMSLRYEKVSKILSLEQHMFGTPEPVYITERNNVVFVSESLMKLKKISNAKFELNTDILPHFLYNGFIVGSHTLIKGVYKLSLGKRLIIERGKVYFEELQKPYIESINKVEDYDALYDLVMTKVLNKSIAFDSIKKTKIALSSGYDSNSILYYLRGALPEQTIDAFSVGGTNGIDETKNALAITKCYENVSFHKAMVTHKTLEDLDDIVYRLQGSVYERGIFLQYELSKLLSKHNCDYLLCGECADQVFHQNTYDVVSKDRFLYDYADTPLEMAYYVVLRKSVSLLKSFGICGIYPFIDDEMIKMGYAIRKLNGTEKAFHKLKCKEKLPAEISSLLVKQGGSTSLSALFHESNDCNIYELLKRQKYYDENYRLTQKYSKEEAIMDYYLILQYIDSFERQFCDK